MSWLEVFRMVRVLDVAATLDTIENTINANEGRGRAWANAEVLDLLCELHESLAKILGIELEEVDDV